MEQIQTDYSNIIEVQQFSAQDGFDRMNRHLQSEEWVLIGVATGTDSEGHPVTVYSLGRLRK
ncbi:hypothetical protein [Serratia marcescens]|uniref:hypothetical protein n=1 Tax=Serratia marcescens TaxID=615 RepID=UPI0029DD4059|nr:hypothetical protein [Serratia marcescens]MDX7546930.1 hypothetical protein [Serratia marcescens]MDX7567560.1 hypothetical protein [Serratia marcescens]